MSIHVLSWVMKNSPAKHGDRLVLFVLADQARSDDGGSCYPAIATIMRDARMSERAVQLSLRNLEKAGLIRTRISASPHGTNDYQVLMRTEISDQGGAKTAPAKNAPPPPARGAENDTEGRNFGAETAPEPLGNHDLTVSAFSADDADATPPETIGQRCNRLAKTYTDAVPLSNFPAIAGVVRKAVNTNLYGDPDILAALARLAQDGRSVTTETLRIELDGKPPAMSSNRPTPTEKASEWLSYGYPSEPQQTAIGGSR